MKLTDLDHAQINNAQQHEAEMNDGRAIQMQVPAAAQPDMDSVREEMNEAFTTAAVNYFHEYCGSKDCGTAGHAYVFVLPDHKGNTKAGKAERAQLAALGARPPNYRGEYYVPCTISDGWVLATQNVDVWEAGAAAAANVLRTYGFYACSRSRID